MDHHIGVPDRLGSRGQVHGQVDLVDLLEEHGGVHDDAIPDDAGRLGMKDARGQQVDDERLAVDHQGVAGVVAALEADHRVGTWGEDVDDLAFSLVTPLGTHHDDVRHSSSRGQPF